jgi:hypothetical protein
MINIDNIISANVETIPWRHRIIDNVFNDDSFKIINEAASHLSYLSVEDKTIPVHINEAISYGISKEAETLILDSADLILANLKEIIGNNCQNGNFGGSYFIMPKFGITGKHFQYPVHDESIYKIMNLVTYLQPTDSIGTTLYGDPEGKTNIKQVEWQPNRAVLFYPQHKKTWHNWRGQPTDQPRITLNFFVEKGEVLKNSLFRPGEDVEDILWFYEQMGKGKLYVEI